MHRVFPGDDLIPDAALVLDRTARFGRPPAEVWPWIAQLGKDRAGWYLPRRLVPIVRHRAATTIRPELQEVGVGDRHPDWGPGDPWFTVAIVEPPHVLVYTRTKPRFTWALLLVEEAGGTRLQLRLRAARAPRIVRPFADAIDRLTVAIMFAGLRERLGG